MPPVSPSARQQCRDPTDADGYVVYFEQLSEDDPLHATNTTAVDVGNTTQYTLSGVIPKCTYKNLKRFLKEIYQM